jgi:hypothetical protein
MKVQSQSFMGVKDDACLVSLDHSSGHYPSTKEKIEAVRLSCPPLLSDLVERLMLTLSGLKRQLRNKLLEDENRDNRFHNKPAQENDQRLFSVFF